MSVIGEVDLDWCRRWQALKWRDAPASVIPLSVAEMDFAPPPAVAEAVQRAAAQPASAYPEGRGLRQVRERIAEFQRREHASPVDADDITIVPGTKVALNLICQWLLRPGDRVVVAGTPCYGPLVAPAQRIGARLAAVRLQPRDGWRLDLDELRAAAADGARLIVLNNPHNPTGRCFGREELEAIVACAAATGAYVLSDEVYEHLTFEGRHTPLANLDAGIEARTITVSSYSKAFNIGGYHAAFLIHRGGLIQEIEAYYRQRIFMTSTLSQFALLGCLDAAPDWLPAVRAYLKDNRSLCLERLGALEGVACSAPEATFFLWLELRRGGRPIGAAELRELAGVELTPAARFWGAGGEHCRLNFGTGREILATALDRIARAWRG